MNTRSDPRPSDPRPSDLAVAADLVGTLHELHVDLGEYALRIWHDYDFGGDSQLHPYVHTEPHGAGHRVRLCNDLEVCPRPAPEPDANNAFQIHLLLEFTPDRAVVETLVEAHLDVSFGDHGPGSYTLYRHRTTHPDVPGALRAAREHALALFRTDDYPVLLGLPPWRPPHQRSTPTETPS
ncbi:hypothetical protein [Micromonospora cathayae]|uniref:Uncharacterized protein n=1 Tax=Micromonospora cathayae TaxID=3028804 RepID=A0ABY7ZVQ5_9ACTN|nr:hypothetical protein [Micromonospora sp. HUAS 3]WDZ87142.1 hypothetical protein PVK37_12410 [Micromonospora sp. HUAS 3]